MQLVPFNPGTAIAFNYNRTLFAMTHFPWKNRLTRYLLSFSDFLVRVRAQVMTRDESTEGWLPLSGGGLANVSVRKRSRIPPDGHEYIIFGQRISDQTVILSCVINRDLQYFKVMPTFHHWRAGKQRNGLTFQTAADARAFDKGIVRAYDDLIDG